jgi:hemolysin III
LVGDVRKVAIGGSKSSSRDGLTTGFYGYRLVTGSTKMPRLWSTKPPAFPDDDGLQAGGFERFVDLGRPISYRSLTSLCGACMTIFRLKQLASTSIHAAADAMHWNYDRAELIADGVVHIVGVCFGLVAATALIVLTAVYATAVDIAAVSVYVAGLLAMLVLSATYNLWPVSRAKWVLRRFDHSAIYLLIAATYTPFIMQLKDSTFAIALLIGVWCLAIVGIGLKIARPGRYDRLATGLYLAMGWSGMMLYDAVVEKLPTLTLGFTLAGGVLYTSGVIFHAWQRLRFQNAIWHGFVLLGAACHYTAILDMVLT